MKAGRTGKAHMRSSYGKFTLPAAIAAGLVVAAFGTTAGAGGLGHRGGFGRDHHGVRAPGRYGHRHGLRYLPTLPILLETPAPGAGGMAPVGRVPGIPDPVPQATAGSPMAQVQGAYVAGGYEAYGLPTALPGAGTYAGGIEAVADVGNGNYFAIDGSVDLEAQRPAARPMAKIIEVKPDGNYAGCEMQKGICIIRP